MVTGASPILAGVSPKYGRSLTSGASCGQDLRASADPARRARRSPALTSSIETRRRPTSAVEVAEVGIGRGQQPVVLGVPEQHAVLEHVAGLVAPDGVHGLAGAAPPYVAGHHAGQEPLGVRPGDPVLVQRRGVEEPRGVPDREVLVLRGEVVAQRREVARPVAVEAGLVELVQPRVEGRRLHQSWPAHPSLNDRSGRWVERWSRRDQPSRDGEPAWSAGRARERKVSPSPRSSRGLAAEQGHLLRPGRPTAPFPSRLVDRDRGEVAQRRPGLLDLAAETFAVQEWYRVARPRRRRVLLRDEVGLAAVARPAAVAGGELRERRSAVEGPDLPGGRRGRRRWSRRTPRTCRRRPGRRWCRRAGRRGSVESATSNAA